MKNIPKKIYLQTGHENPIIDFNHLSLGDITWSKDKINDTDIEYDLSSGKQEREDKTSPQWVKSSDRNPDKYDEYVVLIKGIKDIARYYPKKKQWCALARPFSSPLADNIFREVVKPSHWLEITSYPNSNKLSNNV
jgi:hypothetical protein